MPPKRSFKNSTWLLCVKVSERRAKDWEPVFLEGGKSNPFAFSRVWTFTFWARLEAALAWSTSVASWNDRNTTPSAEAGYESGNQHNTPWVWQPFSASQMPDYHLYQGNTNSIDLSSTPPSQKKIRIWLICSHWWCARVWDPSITAVSPAKGRCELDCSSLSRLVDAGGWKRPPLLRG